MARHGRDEGTTKYPRVESLAVSSDLDVAVVVKDHAFVSRVGLLTLAERPGLQEPAWPGTLAVVDGIGTTNCTYDNANRLTQVEGPYKTVSYGYDNGGRRTTLGLTGQNNVTYSYNAAHYLTSLTNANNETTSWTYNDVGLPTRQDNANSTYAQWTYDANRYWKKSGDW